jgi:hypothetical protein
MFIQRWQQADYNSSKREEQVDRSGGAPSCHEQFGKAVDVITFATLTKYSFRHFKILMSFAFRRDPLWTMGVTKD